MRGGPCSTCHRQNASLEPLAEPNEAREVSLRSLHGSALTCKICAFVQGILSLDPTTPRKIDDLYETSRIKVECGGLRFTGQWQGALVIEVYKAGTHANLPKPKEVSRELSCDNAAGTIKEWMASCEGHAECTSQDPFAQMETIVATKTHVGRRAHGQHEWQSSYPKRLIWLGLDVESARLVPFPPDVVQYAALSYCWGRAREGEHVFKTDKTTKLEFEHGIPLEDVPRTLKDAFCLTKELGLDYLWVDALCIVQGDQEEWEQESAKMGLIYSNAKIVLSSTQSSNVDDGVFMPRSTISLSQDIADPEGLMYARRNMNHEIITSCRTKSNKWWEANINNTFPVLSRGWCFQERMLATRIVHFTPTELVWECQKSRKCECGIVQSHLYPAKNNISSAFRICLKQDVGERGMRQIWREIVRSYSVRKLTNMSDKLAALSGIAALMKNKTGDMYAGGLWKASLPFDLLWRCDQTGDLKTKKERQPSWSWISVDGAVKWPVSQEPNQAQPLEYVTSTTYFESGALGAEVRDVVCEVAGQNDFGHVASGKITLRTRLVEATFRQNLTDNWNEIYETQWAVRVAGSDLAPFWPDVILSDTQSSREERREAESMLLMEVMKPGENTWTWEEALVVRRRNGMIDEFERMGVAANVSSTNFNKWMASRSWFGDGDAREVVLV
ncbi:heterokaryon incompatibility protein-domain-containing protein [Cadophora sp. MPI-SDFR-AT-0126]|nr:heterokaryon incompatibility protein-domain-containing protein [Leotiomycetes sp. MPI-SDFR-AT-0126]